MSILTSEPASFTLGDTVQWRKSFADYPANDGWTLTYGFTGPSRFTLTATADGSGFLVTIAGTLNAEPGNYTWTSYATKAGARTTIASGDMRARPNLAVANAKLDGLEAALSGAEANRSKLAAKLYSSISMESSTSTLRQIDEVEKGISILKRAIADEQNRIRSLTGRPTGNLILTRFRQ